MEKPNQDQIKNWKELYPQGLFHYETEDGYEAWLHFPALKEFRAALASHSKEAPYAFNDSLIANCWIDGDEIIRQDEEYRNGLYQALDEVIDLPDTIVSKTGENFTIDFTAREKTTDGKPLTAKYACTVKPVTRTDVEATSKGNKNPLDAQVKIVKRIWVSGDEIIRKRDDLYASLLSCIDELIQKKTGSVTKL